MAESREQFPRLVRCELLTYVFSYMHRFPKEKLARTVIKFYRTEEISLAKDLLWEFYEQQLGEKQLRHTKKDTVNEMDTRDIVKGALELDKRHVYGKEVAFAATDLERLPKPTPEERSILALMDRVSVLEAQVADLNKIKDSQLQKLKDPKYLASIEERASMEPVASGGRERKDMKEVHATKKKAIHRKSRKDMFQGDEVDSVHDDVKLLGDNNDIKRERQDSYCESKKEQECILS